MKRDFLFQYQNALRKSRCKIVPSIQVHASVHVHGGRGGEMSMSEGGSYLWKRKCDSF